MSTAIVDGSPQFADIQQPSSGPGVRGHGLARAFLSLTAAQILALNGTPLQVAPAPGAGKMIIPIRAVVNVQAGATPFTNGSSGVLTFSVGSMSVAQSAGNTSTLFDGAANTRQHASFDLAPELATAAATPSNENAPCNVSMGTANLAAGNGTATIVLYYLIEDIAPTA